MRNGGFSAGAESAFDSGSRDRHVDGEAFKEVEADVAHLERAAVQRLRGREVHVSRSAVGLAVSERATVQGSVVGVVAARSLAADEVRTGVLIAPIVRGDVHTLLDIRAAIAVGVGMGLARILISGLRGLGRTFWS